MYRTVLVPLDDADFGHHAIPWALAVAGPAGARVLLVHVLVPLYGMPDVDGTLIPHEVADAQRAARETRLRDLAERLTAETGVRLTAIVIEGDIADALLDYATAHAVDLIVMTTHGRGGIARALLGSVSDAVVRRSRSPVLLVRPKEHEPEERAAVAVSNLLVLLDGTPASEVILDHALELCALKASACTLLHIVAPTGPLTGTAPLDALADPRAGNGRDAATYLARHAERFQERGIPVSAVVRRGIDVPAEIADYCASHPVSMIAMATKGRGGIERAIVGSMTRTLLRKIHVPFLVQGSP